MFSHRFRALLIVPLICLLPHPASAAHNSSFTEDFSTTTYRNVNYTTADWNTAAGELRLFPFAPSLVNSVDTPGLAHGIAVSGNLAYIGDGQFGLQIIDINNRNFPSLVGSHDTPGSARGVAVSGDLALVADLGSGLQIFDVSDPASPVLVGNYDTPGNAGGVAVAGRLAFVADEATGLLIIDIGNPAAPALVGAYNTPGAAAAVAVAGDHAFVADFNAGLQIIDISNPAGPTLAAGLALPGDARGVAVDGNTVLIADDVAGLQIVDVGDPTVPLLVGSYDSPGNSIGVAVAGDLAFVADFAGGLQVIDISDLAAPILVGGCDTPGNGVTVAVAGDHAFVADYASGMQVIRIGQVVTLPTVAGSLDTAGDANGVVVAGDLAVVTDSMQGIRFIDVTDPASPVLLGSHDLPGAYSYAAALSGNYAFIAGTAPNLQVLDISNPASPVLAGTYDTPYSGFDIEVVGDLAYLVLWTFGLHILDVSDPTIPTLVGSYATPGYARKVDVEGTLAYVADSEAGLQIIDISDPASPSLVGTHDTDDVAQDVVVDGHLAFVTDEHAGFRIVDVSNPANPTLIGSLETPGAAKGVAVAGEFVFLSDNWSDLLIVDCGNPASPKIIGTCSIPGSAVQSAVAGEFAFVAGFSSGLQVIQVFQHEVDARHDTGHSLVIDTTDDAIIRARVTTTQTAGVSWELSPDAGFHWQDVSPDNLWNELLAVGTDLQWRSTLAWTGPGTIPAVTDLQIDWLYDHPVIDAVTDIPNDQGRQVRVAWTRSGHDFVGDASQIVEYAVYRRIDPDLQAAQTTTASEVLRDLSPTALQNVQMMEAAGWDFIASVPVLVEDNYAVVAPTLGDSTISSGTYQTTFRVTALTATPGVFFHSPADSGYSLDNLAPSIPTDFTVTGGLLAWDDPVDPDFRYFTVYGSETGVRDGTEVRIGDTTEAAYDFSAAIHAYYFVSATDFAGNESPAALWPNTVSAAPNVPVSVTALLGNHPNPFNPTTVIAYELAGDLPVRLRVFDLSGRVVRHLEDGTVRSAGRHEVPWTGRDDAGRVLPAGVYLYRLEAGDFSRTLRMILIK